MARIRSKDTAPEMAVRKMLHAHGYRYRLHRKDLPGKPDVVLTKHRVAIFVHGCFWHQHKGCRFAATPKSNAGYWGPKLSRNVQRDEQSVRALQQAGWRVLVVWECACRKGSGSQLLPLMAGFIEDASVSYLEIGS